MTKLRVTGTSAEASVRPTAPYKVHLGVEDGEPVVSCTCPVGAEGSFCKHAVALALVADEPRPARQQPELEAELDVRALLEGLGHEQLVDPVLELAAADELALARREAAHPLDAIPIFEDEVERLVAMKNNDAYRQAVETMAHVAELMRAAYQPAAFEPYTAGVRARHKPKRNLMKLLDARGW